MTGLYVRVERDGKWQSLELDQLTDAEIDWVVTNYVDSLSRAQAWVVSLAKWIRDHVEHPTKMSREETLADQ